VLSFLSLLSIDAIDSIKIILRNLALFQLPFASSVATGECCEAIS